jgi:hypothetical protein
MRFCPLPQSIGQNREGLGGFSKPVRYIKIIESSNNEILKYRYRIVDSCLTDSLIFGPSIRLRRRPNKLNMLRATYFR